MLMAEGVSVTMIDRKPAQIEESASYDFKVYYGDGRRVDVMRQAGAEHANLIVFCMDGSIDAEALRQIRSAFPQAAVVARAYDRRHLLQLADTADHVVRETFESAVLLSRRALESLGVDEARIARLELEYRRRDTERLSQQADSGDPHSGAQLMFRPENPYIDEGEKA